MSESKITDFNLSSKRNWLSPGWHSVFEAKGLLSSAEAPVLIDALSRLLAKNLDASNEVVDLKGADSGVYQGGSDPLVRVLGNCYAPAEKDEAVCDKEAFAFEIRTQFKAFNSRGNIVHASKTSRSGALPLTIDLNNIGRVFPLEIEQFDMALDFYKSKRYPLLGVSPVVTETLKIAYKNQQFELTIDSDQLPTKGALPLARWELFNELSQILERSFSWDLKQNYR